MTRVLFVPLATLYLAVALTISPMPRPAPRGWLWLAAVVAGAVAAVAVDLGHWFPAAIWAALMALQCAELGLAYRPEMYRPGLG